QLGDHLVIHGRRDGAGRYGVHPHIVRPELDRHLARHGMDGAFGSGIGGPAVEADMPLRRCVVDDGAALLCDHVRQCDLGAGNYAVEVHGELTVPLLVGHLMDGHVVVGDGGIVDEHIQPAALLHGGVYEIADVSLHRDVAM